MSNPQSFWRGRRVVVSCSLLCALALIGASSAYTSTEPGPAAVLDQDVPNVDLPRFMGRWYVIASIPTIFERDAYNATEDYEWRGDGKIATTFTYNKGSFDGPIKISNPTGFVSKDNPAIWKMQFLWPFKADYRVLYVDDDHSVTVIGREKRDYVWLMARTPVMDEAVYKGFAEQIQRYGYDIGELVRVPHFEADL